MDVPMLDKEEYAIASQLYAKGFKVLTKDTQERFKESLDYYNDITGSGETEPNAIMHHAIGMYGTDCGKPYRTPKAKICAACGNKSTVTD